MDTIPEGDVGTAISSASGIFGFVTVIFALIGVIIMIVTIWKCIQAFLKQDMGGFIRTLLFGGVSALLCLNLQLGVNLINSGAGIVGNLVDTVTNTLDAGGDAGTSGTAPTGPGAVPLPGKEGCALVRVVVASEMASDNSGAISHFRSDAVGVRTPMLRKWT